MARYFVEQWKIDRWVRIHAPYHHKSLESAQNYLDRQARKQELPEEDFSVNVEVEEEDWT